ncbi:unnamed protein product [Amoebophrya sp. A25]|nr:unnamed protein product [Amoebophrya sp. A25]|eukprot:GSA25T00004026001.1
MINPEQFQFVPCEECPPQVAGAEPTAVGGGLAVPPGTAETFDNAALVRFIDEERDMKFKLASDLVEQEVLRWAAVTTGSNYSTLSLYDQGGLFPTSGGGIFWTLSESLEKKRTQ